MKAKPKEPCAYSRTGWAYSGTPREDGGPNGCTCKPCRKPANEEKALREWRDGVDRKLAPR